MPSDSQRIWITGIVATLVFSLVTDIIPTFYGPRLNIALWDGTFVTLNLTLAVIVGYGLELLIGVGLTAFYAKHLRHPGINPILEGLLYGVATWLVFMVIGIPIFDAVSPFVQSGLMMSPGFFLWRLGFIAPISWLIASSLFGIVIGYFLDLRFSWGRR